MKKGLTPEEEEEFRLEAEQAFDSVTELLKMMKASESVIATVSCNLLIALLADEEPIHFEHLLGDLISGMEKNREENEEEKDPTYASKRLTRLFLIICEKMDMDFHEALTFILHLASFHLAMLKDGAVQRFHKALDEMVKNYQNILDQNEA